MKEIYSGHALRPGMLNENEGCCIIVATNYNEAGTKLISYLNKNTEYTNWHTPVLKLLEAEKDVPLEKRLKILGEVLPVVR
jgi:hypothetical protein